MLQLRCLLLLLLLLRDFNNRLLLGHLLRCRMLMLLQLWLWLWLRQRLNRWILNFCLGFRQLLCNLLSLNWRLQLLLRLRLNWDFCLLLLLVGRLNAS